MIDPVLVRDIALAVPGVERMHPGPYGTAATFSADGRIWGVRVSQSQLDVHIVVLPGISLRQLGRTVQEAIALGLADYTGPILVHIEDLATTPTPESSGMGATPAVHPESPRRTS